jgi:hypothetical protein
VDSPLEKSGGGSRGQRRNDSLLPEASLPVSGERVQDVGPRLRDRSHVGGFLHRTLLILALGGEHGLQTSLD